jgi:hypothetical protein
MQSAQLLLSAAVDASLGHLKQLEKARQNRVMPLLRQEERRLRDWRRKRRDIIDRRLAELDTTSAAAKRLRQERDDMEKYIESRQREWRDMHLMPGESPITRLLLVIEGVT